MNFQKKSVTNFRILGRLSDYLQNRRRLSVLFSIVTKRKFLFFLIKENFYFFLIKENLYF